MRNNSINSDLLLFLAAVIWGFAFVAQRAGMEHIGPFTFNGIRFLLGGISLLPLLVIPSPGFKTGNAPHIGQRTSYWTAGLIAGLVIFIAATLQQVGIVHTTAGKAGFITGLYVILVPVLAMFTGQRTHPNVWFGAAVAVAGLYFLSVNEAFAIEPGDALVLACAFFFAVHILVISRFSKSTDILKLSVIQFFTCGILSLATAMIVEDIYLSGILNAAIPIVYGGVFSVGIAYTLQVFGQKQAHPSSASIILSLEALFAVLGGWLILGEQMSGRNLLGCGLMLLGMIMAQMDLKLRRKSLH